MTERHEPHPTPTQEERAAYRVARYRRPAVWRSTDWRCQCAPGARRPLHLEPHDCLGEDIVLAHWLAYPATTFRVVRMMAWMAATFSGRR